MIPRTLELKNFLSYGSDIQKIDFGHYPLICLSGKNGHGKSALLDAMTWALWGQARKVSGAVKADAHLLRLGQTQMMVSFDFEFNGQTYRVRREFAKTYGKPYAALDFAIIDQITHEIRSLTDKTIRATQDKIEQTVGLSFDAFINSAFLRQGNSNEFSRKSPKERKDILASILGLDRFEIVRKRAMEKIRTAQQQELHLEKLQASLHLHLQKKDALIAQQQTLATSLHAHLQKITDQRVAIGGLQKQKVQFNAQREDAQRLRLSLEHLKQQELIEQKHLIELVQTWRSLRKHLRNLPNAQKIAQEISALQTTLKNHQAALKEHFGMKELMMKAREIEQTELHHARQKFLESTQHKKADIAKLDAQKESLLTECKYLTKQIKDLDAEQHVLKKSLLDSADITARITALEATMIVTQRTFDKRKHYYHIWVARSTSITTQGKQVHEKMQVMHDMQEASCPMCEQNLSASRKKFLVHSYQAHKQRLLHQHRRLASILKPLKERLITEHAHLEAQQKELAAFRVKSTLLDEQSKRHDALTELLNQASNMQQKLMNQANTLELELQKKRKELDEVLIQEQTILQTHAPFAIALKHRQELEAKVMASLYQEAKHHHDEQALLQLELLAKDLNNAELEKERQHERASTVHILCVKLKTFKRDRTNLEKSLKPLAQALIAYQTFEKQEHEAQEHLTAMYQMQQELAKEQGRLDQEVAQCNLYQSELATAQKDHLSIKQHVYDFQAIATALSKDGIQALLIEDAIPEIELEANQLLAALTDNQAQLFIDSLRDLKNGGTKETLDIKISDASGIRPYEMFSGGEAFRIDFALRIAISKLLARRAGTSLQTLIIDEGFGSQDEEGLGHMMDAIHRIQENFSKVIIVSHLPSMKDQFPVHFVVEKDAQGSHVQVVELG